MSVLQVHRFTGGHICNINTEFNGMLFTGAQFTGAIINEI